MISIKNILGCLLLFIFSSCASNKSQLKFTSVNVDNEVYDFGQIQEEANYSFYLTNVGQSPLIIYDVKTSCGCTFPKWTKRPISQNELGEINVNYDAKQPGRFIKTIMVFYNGEESPKILTIKGSVSLVE